VHACVHILMRVRLRVSVCVSLASLGYNAILWCFQGLRHAICTVYSTQVTTTTHRAGLMISSYPQPLPEKCNEGFTKDNKWLNEHPSLLANIPIYDLGIHIHILDREKMELKMVNSKGLIDAQKSFKRSINDPANLACHTPALATLTPSQFYGLVCSYPGWLLPSPDFVSGCALFPRSLSTNP